MVSTGAKMEAATGTQNLSAGVRKTIQSIKEIVGNFSDAEIYVALKEANMDPNETAQKLLNQDPFHLVKRKKDRKKEMVVSRNSTAPEPIKKYYEHGGQGMKLGYVGQGAKNVQMGQGVMKPGHVGQGVMKPGHVGQGVMNSVQVGQGVMKSNSYSEQGGNRMKSDQGGNGPKPNSNSEKPSSNFEHGPKPNSNTEQGGHGPKPNSNTEQSGNVAKPNSNTEQGSYGFKSNSYTEQGNYNYRMRNNYSEQGMKFNSYSDRNNRRGGYIRNVSSGVNREFRVVRDNRLNQSKDIKPADNSTSAGEQVSSNVTVKSGNVSPKVAVNSQTSQGSDGINKKSMLEDKLSSVAGLYSSALDPVHVPLAPANVSAIRREIGVVGPRRQIATQATTATSSTPTTNSVNQSQASTPESGKSFSTNQYNNRTHQSANHQKAPQAGKEWKIKTNQKQGGVGSVVIGSSSVSSSSSADQSKKSVTEVAQSDKVSETNISTTQNVIIAAHIRVSETDRSRLTFGSVGIEAVEIANPVFEPAVERVEPIAEVLTRDESVSVPVPESSSNVEPVVNKHVPDERIQSPQVSESKDAASSSQNVDTHATTVLVQDNNNTYAPSETQQIQTQQFTSEVPVFSTYDPRTGYDISYFRPAVDETVRGQGLTPAQEAVTSHMENTIPVSTIALAQQQQALAQLYPPQLHVPHYPMPYPRQYSQVYPPMAMPGYSTSPAYPHPSNSSYVIMPGSSSPHLNTANIKYGGMPPFKPVVPGGTPTGFPNFPNLPGYTLTSPAGLDESSRLKYKDGNGNIYPTNPQGETSEIWREMPSQYYNMAGPGQAPYMASQSGHASFNAAAAAAQSTHMQQFGVMYHHPSQAGAMAGPHHMSAAAAAAVMGGNVAPGGQVGAYQQQPQYANWTAANF